MPLSEFVKHRLSIAFSCTKDNIAMCRNIVAGSCIPSAEKTKILGDLADVANIIRQHKFEDIDAIEEAIVALSEAYTSVEKLSGGGRLRESLSYILQWLEHIKKTLAYEGLVPSRMEDIHSGNHTVPRTSQSNYGYIDETGAFIPARPGEGHSEYPALNYFPHF